MGTSDECFTQEVCSGTGKTFFFVGQASSCSKRVSAVDSDVLVKRSKASKSLLEKFSEERNGAVCGLRGGLSPVMFPNTAQFEAGMGRHRLGDPPTRPERQLSEEPAPEGNEQPPPEGAKKRSIRDRIKKMIRKPFDKLRNKKEELVLPDPPHPHDPWPVPRRESTSPRAVKKLLPNRRVTDQEVLGSQARSSQADSWDGWTGAGSSRAALSQSARQERKEVDSSSSGLPRIDPTRPMLNSPREIFPLSESSSDEVTKPTQGQPLREQARQIPARPIILTHEMVTSQSSLTRSETLRSLEEAKKRLEEAKKRVKEAEQRDKEAQYRDAAIRRDQIEINFRECERKERIRHREQRRRARERTRRFFRRPLNKYQERRDRRRAGVGQGRERRPHRLTKWLFHRQREGQQSQGGLPFGNSTTGQSSGSPAGTPPPLPPRETSNRVSTVLDLYERTSQSEHPLR